MILRKNGVIDDWMSFIHFIITMYERLAVRATIELVAKNTAATIF
jgi:hypothetical protein